MTKKKKNSKFVIAIFVAVILVLVGVIGYIYIIINESEKKPEGGQEVKTIDDRISPLENQGLFLEINRIRHRGLLEKLLTPFSTNWKNKPSFFYIAKLDHVEYVSKNVEALGSASELLFNTWDSMFQEQKIEMNVEEENETSDVTITLMERVNSGLLGLKTQDVERDKIKLKFNYRTGRWTGDDEFGDYDGFGHYLGDTFEVWFNIYQPDYDTDQIPYWTEVNILGTDPKIDDTDRDPDKDGCSTYWEWRWGYDPHSWDNHEVLDPDFDGIENVEEYQMSKYFSNPYHQDVYVEVDNMEATSFLDKKHYLWEESIQAVTERFSEHNINIYFDQGWPGTPDNAGGSILPHYETVSQDSGMALQFYRHYFPDERKGIFHYEMIVHGGGYSHPAEDNKVDMSIMGYNWKQMLNPLKNPNTVPTPRAWRVHLAAGTMHELGHTLGIEPWTVEGCDNHSSLVLWFTKDWREYRNTWGNYYSVMNYYWIVKNDPLKKLCDYSDGSNADTGYDINDWIHLYLPTFQTDLICVEDPTANPPCYDLLTYELTKVEELEFNMEDWGYSGNLTDQFNRTYGVSSLIQPVDVKYRVYVNINDISNNMKKVRVYGMPDVYPTEAEYLLIKEGFVKSSEGLQFYSQQDLIDDAFNMLEEQE